MAGPANPPLGRSHSIHAPTTVFGHDLKRVDRPDGPDDSKSHSGIRRYRMANEEHVALLKQGVEVWNKWRKENPDVRPDLGGMKLTWGKLSAANLRGADLNGADLSRA